MILIFGSTGSIGSYLTEHLKTEGHVYAVAREENLENVPAADGVIWCQGVNCSDSIADFDYEKYTQVMDSNLNFIIKTLNSLLKFGKLKEGSRLCVISSVWEKIERANKFSYIVSKSALGGFVRSAAVDLRDKGILINSILPGPIDNEMTRQNLTPQQIENLPGFVKLEDIFHLVKYLCIYNTSMTGQSLVLDLGFGIERTL